jgi:hypothetical protein
LKENFCWKNNCAFSGYEKALFSTHSINECGNKCAQNPECTHFTYHSDTSDCHLINAKYDRASSQHTIASCGHIYDRTQVKYMGCFRDNFLIRDMSYQADNVTSIEDCAKSCSKADYKYMGLQDGYLFFISKY